MIDSISTPNSSISLCTQLINDPNIKQLYTEYIQQCDLALNQSRHELYMIQSSLNIAQCALKQQLRYDKSIDGSLLNNKIDYVGADNELINMFNNATQQLLTHALHVQAQHNQQHQQHQEQDIQHDSVDNSEHEETNEDNNSTQHQCTNPVITLTATATSSNVWSNTNIYRIRKHKTFPSHAAVILRHFYESSPNNVYPTSEQKILLATQCGITYDQIQHWFINRRMRNKNKTKRGNSNTNKQRKRRRKSSNKIYDSSNDSDSDSVNSSDIDNHDSVSEEE